MGIGCVRCMKHICGLSDGAVTYCCKESEVRGVSVLLFLAQFQNIFISLEITFSFSLNC
jgi:hypothetical protein